MSLTELQRHARLPSHLPKELTWTREHASCPVRNSFHTVPYLSRTLRPEGYGLMVYSLSIAAFLTIICDYGFSLTAMQSAAERREDVEALRRIFTAVMIAKLLIFLACLLTFGLLVAVVPQLQQHWRVHLLALLSTFGALVFPGWLFQAMQKMTQLAWVSITARGIAVVAIFLFCSESLGRLACYSYPRRPRFRNCSPVLGPAMAWGTIQFTLLARSVPSVSHRLARVCVYFGH